MAQLCHQCPNGIEHQCAQYHQLFDFLQQQSFSKRDRQMVETLAASSREENAPFADCTSMRNFTTCLKFLQCEPIWQFNQALLNYVASF